MKYSSLVFLNKENALALSLNFSSVKTPYWIKHLYHPISFQSQLYPFLNMPFNLSATFLVIWFEIFFTLPSLCKYDLDTFNGISGESITPCNNVKNSGTMFSTESVINTWLL